MVVRLFIIMLVACCTLSAIGEGIPEGPQIRIIPLASPLKSEDRCGQWMHPEYTAEDILEMIEGLKPQVLEPYITGAQNPKAKVPVRKGNPKMTVKEFLNASLDAGAPGCIIIPKLNLTWISWGKEKYFWEAAENNYTLPLKRPIRITNLDNWNGFIEKHGEKRAREVLERLKDIGYEQLGVNMAGGYKEGFGHLSFANFLINKETWELRLSTLEKMKRDPHINQYYLYIDYPGQMDEFMELPVDKQADVFTKVIRQGQKKEKFTFVYPVLFDKWDANKQLTSKTGKYKGASMYEVIQNEINPGHKKSAATIGKLHLFILAGQSNMKHMLPFDTFTPAVTEAFRGDDIVVVRNAVGGCPIRRWYKDWKPATEGFEYNDSRTGHMYEGMQRKIAEALGDRKPDTVTLVWMQGERDAADGQHGVYAESLKGLIRQLSTDLNRHDINFVIGRLSDTRVGEPGWDAVREIQVETATLYKRGAWVDTDDLNGPDNDVHYTDDGYRKLGERFAEKAIGLMQKQ
ncbi:MAG: sialate O-acetylesterase [Kiritimatiellales bacterium]|nr:sialate O-acetylesterase [Kiritimatiellales bacterium]